MEMLCISLHSFLSLSLFFLYKSLHRFYMSNEYNGHPGQRNVYRWVTSCYTILTSWFQRLATTQNKRLSAFYIFPPVYPVSVESLQAERLTPSQSASPVRWWRTGVNITPPTLAPTAPTTAWAAQVQAEYFSDVMKISRTSHTDSVCLFAEGPGLPLYTLRDSRGAGSGKRLPLSSESALWNKLTEKNTLGFHRSSYTN